jgi:hypothetical protein
MTILTTPPAQVIERENTVMKEPIEAPTRPTRQQLRDEIGCVSVRRDLDDASPSHGDNVTEIFCRECDNTYWRVCYFISDDGFLNGLQSVGHHCCNPVEITHVYPVEVVTIKYTPVE